jgi:hypothetical protein
MMYDPFFSMVLDHRLLLKRFVGYVALHRGMSSCNTSMAPRNMAARSMAARNMAPRTVACCGRMVLS